MSPTVSIMAATFRAEIVRKEPQPRSAGYPLELRTRVGRWILEQHQVGSTWAQLASQLGISRSSARSWAMPKQIAPSSEFKFLPVVIRPEPLATEPSERTVLHTPSGYRVTGLELETLIALLRDLE